ICVPPWRWHVGPSFSKASAGFLLLCHRMNPLDVFMLVSWKRTDRAGKTVDAGLLRCAPQRGDGRARRGRRAARTVLLRIRGPQSPGMSAVPSEPMTATYHGPLSRGADAV